MLAEKACCHSSGPADQPLCRRSVPRLRKAAVREPRPMNSNSTHARRGLEALAQTLTIDY